MTTQSAETVLAAMAERFTSGNEVPVERAYIKRDEWRALLNEVEDALFDNHDADRAGCKFCQLLKAVADAREKLS